MKGLTVFAAILAYSLVLCLVPAQSAFAQGSTDTISLFPACTNGLRADINGVATPGASVTSINWNWGDGATTTGFFPQSHAYALAGSHSVQVTANYSDSSSASASETINLVSGNTSGCVGLEITTTQGGSVIYQSSVGSGIVIPTMAPDSGVLTLQLDLADDLILASMVSQ